MKPRIMAPVQNLKGAKNALDSGADLLYGGLKGWSLRPNQFEMSPEEFVRVVTLTRSRGKEIYLAMNCFYRGSEIPQALELIGQMAKIGLSGVIVSELGLARAVRERFPELKLQLSVQISASNTEELKFYRKMGFSGVVLPRNLVELCPQNLQQLALPGLELEIFILGDDSPNHDGNCFLSSFLNQRIIKDDTLREACHLGSANRNGYCYLMCKRKTEYFREGFSQGCDYHLRRGDLHSFRRAKELAASGAAIFKVQGREFPPALTARLLKCVRKLADHLENPEIYAAQVKELDRLTELKLRLQDHHLKLLALSRSPFWRKLRPFIEPLWDNFETALFLCRRKP